MELKEFVKKVIMDLDQAVSEANNETSRVVRFKGVREQRTALEFDVAVTVESNNSVEGGGGIRVWGIGQVAAAGSSDFRNSTISRVTFGIDIAELTKQEDENEKRRLATQFRPTGRNGSR